MKTEKGKKIYKTTMLHVFRLFVTGPALFFLYSFYLETFKDERFLSYGATGFKAAVSYHLKYPYEFISFLIIIFVPYLYYCFIRGSVFYEKGFTFNKGMPFLNIYIPYVAVTKYKLLHPETIMAISTHRNETFLIADNNLPRIIAILDQQNIQGDLASKEYVTLLQNMFKFFIIVFGFTILLLVLKKFGFLG